MSEKVYECEGGSAVASAEGCGNSSCTWQESFKRVDGYVFQSLSGKCVSSFKGILLKQIK